MYNSVFVNCLMLYIDIFMGVSKFGGGGFLYFDRLLVLMVCYRGSLKSFCED